MHNKPGAQPHARQSGNAATFPEFTEEQLMAFDRAYAVGKDTGALDQLQVAAAVRLELSHNRSARLA
ncbi:hypothetical protein [Variovorax paradoxus]|uniref:hypothetical protein n=1 Tax=Variovorax paradoxus TaxID=34073 RepID=UPI003D66194C